MAGTLSARGISQRFGDRTVLTGVDLDLPAGRVVGLLGPNGAGKTTLMHILFGVLQPDAGTVVWRDRPATDEDRRSVAARFSAVVYRRAIVRTGRRLKLREVLGG